MTHTAPPNTSSPDNAAGLIGLWLVRAVVPFWIAAGATAKLVSKSPKLLPEHLRDVLIDAGLDLHVALAIFITIEFAAVAVMVCIPRLARITAVFMLIVFCLVLLWEMFNGNLVNCGCLGSVSPPPWVMLSIDALLLIMVAALPVRTIRSTNSRMAWALASVLALGLGVLAFTRVLSAATGVIVVNPNAAGSTDTADARSTSQVTTPTISLPAYYALDTEQWVGKQVDDIELLSWIPGLGDDIKHGQQYLIFYSRTCEHCQELLLDHFSFDPPAPTSLIAIPERADGFNTEGELENPCVDCRELELPIGVDWLMTPPVVVSIEDGRVVCAQEAEDAFEPQCLPWHGF